MTVHWWYPHWLRRLLCRYFGHRPSGGVIYQVGRARVGEGCSRCLEGSVREYRCQYPVPRSTARS